MLVSDEFVCEEDVAAWITPLCPPTEVNRAGRVLMHPRRTQDDWYAYFDAVDIINNWRSSHSFPLLCVRVFLQRNAESISPDALVAQRIRRLYSIELKLRRFRTMRLVQMQDIGGCRAIVGSIQDVMRLSAKMRRSRTRNKLDHIDDYVTNPQRSGYRGIHHIYEFDTDAVPACNGLKIEVQLRSPYQHAWATAVETVGTFTRQALKSSQGSEEWLRFFQLMGTVVAKREGTTSIPNTPEDAIQLVDELRQHAERLNIVNRLTTFGNALNITETDTAFQDARFFLLELDPNAQNVTVSGFKRDDLMHATRLYADVEKKIAETGGDAVLVSVDSLAALRRAYPNYFLDTRVFIGLLDDAILNRVSLVAEKSS